MKNLFSYQIPAASEGPFVHALNGNDQATLEQVTAENTPLNTGDILTEQEYEIIHELVTDILPSIPNETLRRIEVWKEFPKQILDQPLRKELSKLGRLTQIRRAIYACVVRQVIINEQRPLPSSEDVMIMPFSNDTDFTPTCLEEIQYLRYFLRAISTLHYLGLPGSNNKQTYIETAAMLEGSNKSYAFGGAPAKATIRRSVIFHVVTGAELRDITIHMPKKRRTLNVDNEQDDEFIENQSLLDDIGGNNKEKMVKTSRKFKNFKDLLSIKN